MIRGTDSEYAEAVLAALAGMAVRSPRRQADLGVAMRRSGLDRESVRLEAALQTLLHDGCVDRMVSLDDGGVLVQVTSRGIDRMSHVHRSFATEAYAAY